MTLEEFRAYVEASIAALEVSLETHRSTLICIDQALSRQEKPVVSRTTNSGKKPKHKRWTMPGSFSSQVIATVTAPMTSREIGVSVFGDDVKSPQMQRIYGVLHYLKTEGKLNYDGEYYSKTGTPANE